MSHTRARARVRALLQARAQGTAGVVGGVQPGGGRAHAPASSGSRRPPPPPRHSQSPPSGSHVEPDLGVDNSVYSQRGKLRFGEGEGPTGHKWKVTRLGLKRKGFARLQDHRFCSGLTGQANGWEQCWCAAPRGHASPVSPPPNKHTPPLTPVLSGPLSHTLSLTHLHTLTFVHSHTHTCEWL